MKKISILLILCMIISLIPALNVSAAGEEYYLKGLYEGATVILQHEPTKTVTLVDIANAGYPANSKSPVVNETATNVNKVVFTFNDGAPQTIMGSNLSYTMAFTEPGPQTLKYDVYKTTGDGVTPDQSTTVTFNVVSGKKNAASVNENFDGLDAGTSSEALKKIIVANDGANASSAATFSLVESYNHNKTEDAVEGKAVQIASTTRTPRIQLKNASGDTVHGVHYYSFDLSWTEAYTKRIYLRGDSYSATTNQVEIISSKKFAAHSSRYTKAKLGIVLDYNAQMATVSYGGKVWYTLSIAAALAGTGVPALVIDGDNLGGNTYIDNFSYTAYDVVPTPTITAASIAGGDKPVLETQNQVRFTGSSEYLDGQDPADFVAVAQRANDSDGDFVAATVGYDVAIDGADIVVNFTENLAAGTTYQVLISGIKDEYLMTYADYDFTFRTLNPGENPLPEITLTSPVADERYYPNESTITLSADAFDTLGGSVTKVEFFVDGQLIGEGTNLEGDTYTYAWTLDDSIDKPEPVAITAKATDNGGDSSETMPVNIVIWSKQLPEITITSPAQDTVYCASIGGVAMEVKPKIEFTTADADGTIAAVNVYVDGNPGIPVDNPAEATSYTLTENLAVGEHTITVEAYDDHEQRVTDSVTVLVEAKGKAGYVLNEDYGAEDLLAKWNKSGEAEFSTDAEGVAISGTGSAYRAVQYNFTDKAFVADIKVSFADTTAGRTVKLGDTELATFSASGKITYGGSQVGTMTYQAGEVYNITAVIDADNDKIYSLVNGNAVGTASATVAVNTKIDVSQTGAGVATIKAVSVSLIGEAAQPTVDVNGNEITVSFPAGVDEATLEGNVSVVNVETGKAVSLIYANGVFTVNEVLKYDTQYEVSVLPDVRDINGNGFSGTYKYTFTTEEPATVGVADVTVTAPTLAEGNFTATLEVEFNGADETKTVYLVCAAYNGAKMEDYQVITLTAPVTASDIDIALSGVSETAVVEAFVVDSLDDLNSVSDKIFVIR